MVTEYRRGVHADAVAAAVDPLPRTALVRHLPKALAEFTALTVPTDVRRHGLVDSLAGVVDRALVVRQRMSEQAREQGDAFGISEGLLHRLRTATGGFTPRPPSPQHNDIHESNVLVEFTETREREIVRAGVTLLDLQTVTVADPLQDLAMAAVKFRCPPTEVDGMRRRWAAAVGPARSAGAAEDLPTAMAVMSATQASVAVPNGLARVRRAAENDRANLERVIDEVTSELHTVVWPAIAYGEGRDVGEAWLRSQVAKVLPRTTGAIGVTGPASSAVQRAWGATPSALGPVANVRRTTAPTPDATANPVAPDSGSRGRDQGLRKALEP